MIVWRAVIGGLAGCLEVGRGVRDGEELDGNIGTGLGGWVGNTSIEEEMVARLVEKRSWKSRERGLSQEV